MQDEIRKQIEQDHNVYVSDNGHYYTHGQREDLYGWEPLPGDWVIDAIYSDFDLD
jgi:hypothetical protein